MYDKKEKHCIYKKMDSLNANTYHSAYFKDIEFGDVHLKANLSISRYAAFKDILERKKNNPDDELENWYIISNIEPNKALRKYSKRFGLIEMFFKSQKNNVFYLEKTKIKNLSAFEVLYGVICIASLWLNILGVDYIKNYNHIKSRLNIRFNKKTKSGNLVRILSTFNFDISISFYIYKNFACYFFNKKNSTIFLFQIVLFYTLLVEQNRMQFLIFHRIIKKCPLISQLCKDFLLFHLPNLL